MNLKDIFASLKERLKSNKDNYIEENSWCGDTESGFHTETHFDIDALYAEIDEFSAELAERTTAPVSLTDEKIIEAIDRPGFAWENLDAAEQRNLLGSIRALLAAAPAPIQQEPVAFIVKLKGNPQKVLCWPDMGPRKRQSANLEYTPLYATPPALAGSQAQGDEVNEREAFEAMVKERFVTTEHSLARAHPYGYYNTVSSDTFGGRRQPDYANVQMLWDVWDARATIAKKVMREQP